jgi:hypothetical protein
VAGPLPFGRAVAVEVANSFSALAGGTPAVLATRVRFFQQQGYDATVALSSDRRGHLRIRRHRRRFHPAPFHLVPAAHLGLGRPRLDAKERIPLRPEEHVRRMNLIGHMKRPLVEPVTGS